MCIRDSVKLVPPTTIDSAVTVAFDEVTRTVDDNAGLAKLVTDTSYWNTAAKHGSYDSVPVGTRGETPVQLTVRWIVALAADLTGDSTLAEKVGAVLTRSAQLLATTDTVRPAGQILAAGTASTRATSTTATSSSTTPSATTTTTPAGASSTGTQ